MDKLSFKLVVFEGPLDLLLHLISKNKVNIYDIPIKEITAQYFEVIEQMQKMDLEVSSEFIIMAAQSGKPIYQWCLDVLLTGKI